MTRFWRNGFERSSIYGDTHWVEGHWVERDDWNRYSYGPTPTREDKFLAFLRESCALSSATARYVKPNATCPVCGADVYFYQNEYGSRVFFDELGPPWPKHPCTDTSEMAENKLDIAAGEIEPKVRPDEDISTIQTVIDATAYDPVFIFKSKYGKKPILIAKLLRRIKSAKGVLLILRQLQTDTSKKWFVCCKSLPRHIKEGSLVFVTKRTLSFFDMDTMTPKEQEFRRVKSASAFIDEITASDTVSS